MKMDLHYSHETKSISSVVGNWYRVTGTPSEPIFEKIVLWAILNISESSNSNKIVSKYEYIAGIPLDGIGVASIETEYFIMSVAGYIECSKAKIDSIKSNPSSLSEFAENLCWDDLYAD